MRKICKRCKEWREIQEEGELCYNCTQEIQEELNQEKAMPYLDLDDDKVIFIKLEGGKKTNG